MKRKKIYSALLKSFLLVAMILAPGTARSAALPEPVGEYVDVTLLGTTAADRPELAGTVIEDVLKPYSFSGAGEVLTGRIQNRVVQSVDGTLDFYWRIIPDAYDQTSNTGDILAFRVAGFAGFALDADWRSDGLGIVAPDTARYFGSDDGAVNFLFQTNEVGPGESSYFFFLDTQATAYAEVGRYDLLCAPSGGISPSFTTFAPVPAPSALFLLGSGLIGLLGFRKRLKK